MSQDVEALLRRQAELDDEIERRILAQLRRKKYANIVVVIALFAVVAGVGWGIYQRVTAPSLGIDDFYQLAMQAQDNGDLAGAATELRKVLQEDPERTDVRRVLGELYLALGNGKAAEKELRQARILGDREPGLNQSLLSAMMLQRRYTEVLVDSLSVTSTVASVASLITQGEAHTGLGQLEKAIEAFGEILIRGHDSLPALVAIARIHLVSGSVEDARLYLDRVLELNPTHLEARILLGRLALLLGNFDLARQDFEIARAGAPLAPEALLGLAQTFLAEGKPTVAEQHLHGARKIVRDSVEIQYLLAVAALQRGDFQAARPKLLKLLKQAPEHIDALLLMASVNFNQQEYRQAETIARTLLSISPGHRQALRFKATVLLELGELKTAIETLIALEDEDETDAQVLALLARAYLLTGDAEASDRYLGLAAEVGAGTDGNSGDFVGSPTPWRFEHCGLLVHFCQQCLYVRECR